MEFAIKSSLKDTNYFGSSFSAIVPFSLLRDLNRVAKCGDATLFKPAWPPQTTSILKGVDPEKTAIVPITLLLCLDLKTAGPQTEP